MMEYPQGHNRLNFSGLYKMGVNVYESRGSGRLAEGGSPLPWTENVTHKEKVYWGLCLMKSGKIQKP